MTVNVCPLPCVNSDRRWTKYGVGVIAADAVGGLVNVCSAIGDENGRPYQGEKACLWDGYEKTLKILQILL